MAVQQDITEHKQAEEKIKASLKEKEVLLKEIHHRVKNNLGIVSSLLQMQCRRTQDPPANAILRDSQNRIASIALVHEKLYRSEELADIDFAQYIPDLTTHLFDSYNVISSHIQLNIQVDHVSLKPIKEQELYVAIQTALNRYEREQFLSSVLRGMGDGVVIVDRQLRVKYLNRIAEALTGWRLDEVKDQILSDDLFQFIDEQTQLPADNPLISAFQEETTICQGKRLLLVARDGTKIPVANSSTPLIDKNSLITGAIMLFRDDTQRLLTEEENRAAEPGRQLEIQIAELQRIKQLKEDFLVPISQEMQMPLSNIKMAIYSVS